MSAGRDSGTGGLPRGALLAVLLVVGIMVAAVGVAIYATSQPGYFARYHLLQRSADTLARSSHAGLACNACHVDTRGAVLYEAALIGDFYRGLVKTPKLPVFVRMPTPRRSACLQCHREDWSYESTRTLNVPHPAHLRVADEKRECVTCHKWVAHEETYMRKHKGMPFSTVCASFPCHVGTKRPAECRTCHHQLQPSLASWKQTHPQTVRAVGPGGCLERCHEADQCRTCHTTGKRPRFKILATQVGVEAIEREHVKASWISRHGAMALADQRKCILCHVSTGECRDCHAKRPAFHGPQATWLGRHQKLGKNKPRCLTCHEQKWCEACHAQFKEMR
ncbi:MAG: hypothetical protein FDZ75_00250 [Actinobacteria bacterium]|nr:MAG: hypothetical protein FDZ75_00250 [Actinomycetota bacterium]